jgi:hypothetical protein
MKKLWSILRWVLYMLVSLMGFLTAPIVYPLLYPFKDNFFIRSTKPFWYYFDDEDGNFGFLAWRMDKGYDLSTKWNRFKCAYHWLAIRNPAWNLQASLRPYQGAKDSVEEIYVSSKGALYNDGYIEDELSFAVLNFENQLGEFTHGVGEYLSYQYSIFGSLFLWYKIENKLYWRYSLAKNMFKDYYIEIQIGTGYRYVFRFKIIKAELI